MTKYKIILSFLTFFLMSDMLSKTLNIPPCDTSKEECFTYEYFGDTNRNGKAHGEGKMVWEHGLEIEGRWINGNLIEGKSIYNDGSGYEGEYKNYMPHGYGERIWPNGGSYKGRWKNGIKHGRGIEIFVNTDDLLRVSKYDGDWVEGRPTGNASITYSDGSSYKGKVIELNRNGYGEYVYADRESSHKGEFKDNQFHGIGVQTLASGRVINGNWKEGLLDGYVEIDYESGETFAGNFKKNKMEGYGEGKDRSGQGYSGNYKNDLPDGFGTLTLRSHTLTGNWEKGKIKDGTREEKDGTLYRGTFNEIGQYHGTGELNYKGDQESESFLYTGQFVNGRLSGNGIKTWTADNGMGLRKYKYSGEFKNNVQEGKGELWVLNDDGSFNFRVYIGDYLNNLFHGKGTIVRINGNEPNGFLRGEFKEGIPHGEVYDEFTIDGRKTTFSGKYENGLADGYGESYEITDEVTMFYQGDHQAGKRLGKATITLTNNKTGKSLIKKGVFTLDGQLNGPGEIQFPSGAVDKGFFEDNILVDGIMKGALGINFSAGTTPYTIGYIREDSAASNAGFMIGDTIIAIKENYSDWVYLSELSDWEKSIDAPLRLKNGSIFEIKVQRGKGLLAQEKILEVKSSTIKLSRIKEAAESNDIPRVALIIGNSNYESSKLDNPINDAELMKKSLEDKGFQTIIKLDTSKEDFKKAVWEFGDLIEELGPKTTALFYYSGHGMQANGKNYLIPLGSRIRRLREVETEAIAADEVMNALAIAERGIKIMILDACRDNPFRSFTRNIQQGLAEMDSPTGTIIAYSTAPGRTALDGGFDLGNSIYTKSLAESMEVYDLTIEEVFKRTRREVEEVTDGDQVPWESSSLLGDFYFNQFN